ncbi:MAG: hypothetical protein EPN45_06230 [Rhizobiaceae bacterium]|nr:MAG: hypothetical protein EPN45_06230 [Rhizobiaceae bacterium]
MVSPERLGVNPDAKEDRHSIDRRAPIQLRQEGYQRVGLASFPVNPDRPISEATDIEEYLAQAAEADYQDSDSGRSLKASAIKALEEYRRVVALYGKERLTVSVSHPLGVGLATAFFYIEPSRDISHNSSSDATPDRDDGQSLPEAA